MQPIDAVPARPEPRFVWAWLLLICAPFFFQLDAIGLTNPDEGRYTDIGRAMAASGDWLIPRMNGVPHWAKPPLSYWAIAASLKLFGFHETAARLPSAIASVVTVLVVFALGRRISGTRAGLFAAATLATTFEFFALARTANTDMIQCACITSAVACLWIAKERVVDAEGVADFSRLNLKATTAAFLCLGLSFLAKGPVGLGVVGATFVVYALLTGAVRLATPKRLAGLFAVVVVGLIVTASVGLPWFLAVCAKKPDLYHFFLKREVVDRYTSEELGRNQPFWFFPAVFPAALLPWTLILVACVIAAVKRRRSDADVTLLPRLRVLLESRAWRWGPDQALLRSVRAGAFLAAWVVGPFLLFQFSKSKLWTYLLPLYPPAALLIGRMVAHWAERGLDDLGETTLRLSRAMPLVMFATLALISILKFDVAAWRWAPPCAAALALSVAFEIAARRSSPERRTTIEFASVAVLAFLVVRFAIVVFDREADVLDSQSSRRWVAEALKGVEVHGVPISTSLGPHKEKPRFADGVTGFVAAGSMPPSIPFYVARGRPEAIPVYGSSSAFEMEQERAADLKLTYEDCAEILRRPERTYVLLRRSELPKLTAVYDGPLKQVARGGNEKYEMLLLRTR